MSFDLPIYVCICHIKWGQYSGVRMQDFLWTLWKLGLNSAPLQKARPALVRKSESWFPYSRMTHTCNGRRGKSARDGDTVETCDK